MRLSQTNIVLAVLLVALALAIMSGQADYSQPNYEFLPEMKRSAAYAAYEANPVFENGRTLQMPVAGTIPRGELPLHYTASKEDALRAGEELKNPYGIASAPADASHPRKGAATENHQPQEPADRSQSAEPPSVPVPRQPSPEELLRQSIQRGEQVYQVFCLACHGPQGAGDGPVAKRGFPPPPSLTVGKSLQMKDGQLFHILTYGQGNMPPMAGQLTRNRRWDVINFVRRLQQQAKQAQANQSAGTSQPGDTDPSDKTTPNREKAP